jgi:hypothetical protein
MKLTEITSKIDSICKQFKIENYTINPKTGRIDVDETVDLNSCGFEFLPIDFGIIKGNFYLQNCHNLRSLKGCPTEVRGSFYCTDCPELTSLKYGPTIIRNDYRCLVNHKLTSLEGAPEFVGEDFACANNPKLEKLSHLKEINGDLNLLATPITNLLFVFKIKGLKEVYTGNDEISEIINKHLAGNRDIMECQDELIEAGFKRYANLK